MPIADKRGCGRTVHFLPEGDILAARVVANVTSILCSRLQRDIDAAVVDSLKPLDPSLGRLEKRTFAGSSSMSAFCQKPTLYTWLEMKNQVAPLDGLRASMDRPQGASHGTTIVVSELTQFGNVFDHNVRSVDYNADGSQLRKGTR